ncbi:unnamed protein product [Phytophthora fragariaefolia]|uniref:Unnamed protein product n=1 Tax=Phytophthora fragariaefolia TaxID=1490495 RepID=A0A9W6YN76_9STRA|nr:unnamed protein product [Phytophthora fragariaefolia]
MTFEFPSLYFAKLNCTKTTLNKDELQPESESDGAGINPATLAKLARRVRSSILQLDSEYLRDSIEFIADQEHLSRVVVSTKHILGPDLMFTSWANMGLYNPDFNGARPCYAGIAKVPFLDGLVVIAEAAKGVDGLDILVFLECAAMESLKVLYGKFLHLQDQDASLMHPEQQNETFHETTSQPTAQTELARFSATQSL